MNCDEALKEVGKHEPCPHDAVNTNLGNGEVWARCDDCGETIRQDSIPKLRAENERFHEALLVIRRAIGNADKSKIKEAISLLEQV
jgi:hypothetical protein